MTTASPNTHRTNPLTRSPARSQHADLTGNELSPLIVTHVVGEDHHLAPTLSERLPDKHPDTVSLSRRQKRQVIVPAATIPAGLPP
jgi:hypothetical protein